MRRIEVGAPLGAQAVEELGERLRASISALLTRGGGAVPRPTHLARTWRLEQTLCLRVCGALRSEDPLGLVHRLPSPTALRGVIGRAEEHDAHADALLRARRDVDDLEALIDRVGGRKTNLDTLLGSRLPEIRRRVAQRDRQAIYRGMIGTLGHHARAAAQTFFLHPAAERPGFGDVLFINSVRDLQRLRPEESLIACWQYLDPERPLDLDDARRALHSGNLRENYFSVALEEHSSSPFPRLEFVRAGGRLAFVLPGDEEGWFREVSYSLSSFDRACLPAHRTEGFRHAKFGGAPMPVKDMIIDVFVHREIWPSTTPSLWTTRLDPEARDDETLERLEHLRLDEDLQDLGDDPRAVRCPMLPRYGQLVDDVVTRMGWQRSAFRLYRLHVRYPVVGIHYLIRFDLPAAPDSPAADSASAPPRGRP